jgi:hypothetical protein
MLEASRIVSTGAGSVSASIFHFPLFSGVLFFFSVGHTVAFVCSSVFFSDVRNVLYSLCLPSRSRFVMSNVSRSYKRFFYSVHELNCCLLAAGLR